MSIYLIIVASVLILGAMMPQKGRERIWYIALMTAVHAFVCAFRYNHLTGDLMKYHHTFNVLSEAAWFGPEVYNEGRNFGFMFLMKLMAELSGGDFQVALIVIAVVTHLILGYMIYRYSPAPWLSFLVWNCMALYIFGFSAIKQALAMSVIMLSFIAISRKKLVPYLALIAIAGMIHMPALVFLPAYWMAQMKVKNYTIILYAALGILMYAFKEEFVQFISSFYYDEDEVFVFSGEIGNRFIMLVGFALFGIMFRGFFDRNYEKFFHIMMAAAILQMLAGFDNIFTRMSDYYFQFSVLYIPMTFAGSGKMVRHEAMKPWFPFNKRSMKAITALVVIFVIWFYYTYTINVNIAYAVDDYTNFRFMWDVK